GRLHQLYATATWLKANDELVRIIPGDRIIAIDEKELESISTLSTPNEVVAILRQPERQRAIELKDTLTLMLDSIQDPGNLGTIIRCADWFGVRQIVCSNECADVYNSKVVQSTMGSIGRIDIHYTDLQTLLEHNPEVQVYAAVLGGNSILDMKPVKEGIILIGNESKGIRSSLLNDRTVRITIPGKGEAESLNAAVATGIILSHLI
ncbi:MAG: RNA methyltransferase, partial [Chitinophagaceae bacterium]|nr:RNA methyltransferase [Chitinophagaceae bacterium]